MSTTQKKKLCWNCEGRVDLEEQNCPFCAVYLGPAPSESGERKDDILAPPYKIVDSHESEITHHSPYQTVEEPSPQIAIATQEQNDIRKVALPITLLSGGLVFLLFGMILYFFSANGVFTLQWNGTYWYLYLTLALPLLGVGIKMLQQIDQES